MLSNKKSPSALNFAVLCEGAALEAWMILSIKHAATSDFANLVSVFTVGEPNPEATASLDGALHGMSAAVANLAWPNVQRAADALPHFHNLDFVLAFCSPEIAAHVSHLMGLRLGVWAFEVSGGPTINSEARIDRLIELKASTVECTLVRLGPTRAILHAGQFAIIPQSIGRTLNEALMSASPWVKRACANILLNGEPAIDVAPPPSPLPPKRFKISRAVAALSNRARMLFRYKAQRQQWNVGVIRAPIAVVAGLNGPAAQAEALSRTFWMPEVPHHFFADPFGFKLKDGRVSILMERLDWRRPVGEIVSVTFDGLDFTSPRLVLDAGTHLSYPFVLQMGADRVFIPEHSAAKNVSAFSIDESGQITGKKTWLDHVELLDCTFFEQDHRWWMFACVDSHAKNSELHIFFSDGEMREWFAHPLNPVKSDVRSARPGGNIFSYNGMIYRPGQDCSTHYGRAIAINEIEILTPTNYRERTTGAVLPIDRYYKDGLHTLSSAGDYTLIDGSRQKWAWSR